MEVLEDRGDVVTGAGISEQTSSRVLGVLKFNEDFGRCTMMAIAKVVSDCDEGGDQGGPGDELWSRITPRLFYPDLGHYYYRLSIVARGIPFTSPLLNPEGSDRMY